MLGRAPGRLAKPEVALELGSCSCRRLLHDLDLVGGQAVELVDELVNLVVGGGDLALEGGLQMLKCKTRPPAFSLLAC